MKIQPVQPALGYGKASGVRGKKENQPGNGATVSGPMTDHLVREKKTPVITYGKPQSKLDAVSRLKEESAGAYASLRRIVVELLERQGYCALGLKGGPGLKPGTLEIDEIAREEAARLIADDGPLGPEAVSERIVNFAIAVSGGDKSKLSQLKAAIEEGFRQVKNMLGALPEVSLRTYDLIMEKLDRWEKERQARSPADTRKPATNCNKYSLPFILFRVILTVKLLKDTDCDSLAYMAIFIKKLKRRLSMHKHIEVIHMLLPLLSTIEEGLNHIKVQISELRYEAAFGLLEDSVLGIASIEGALGQMAQILPEKISPLTAELKKSIVNVVESYEKGKQEIVEKQIEKEVLPAFRKWKEELENTLKPYILS